MPDRREKQLTLPNPSKSPNDNGQKMEAIGILDKYIPLISFLLHYETSSSKIFNASHNVRVSDLGPGADHLIGTSICMLQYLPLFHKPRPSLLLVLVILRDECY